MKQIILLTLITTLLIFGFIAYKKLNTKEYSQPVPAQKFPHTKSCHTIASKTEATLHLKPFTLTFPFTKEKFKLEASDIDINLEIHSPFWDSTKSISKRCKTKYLNENIFALVDTNNSLILTWEKVLHGKQIRESLTLPLMKEDEHYTLEKNSIEEILLKEFRQEMQKLIEQKAEIKETVLSSISFRNDTGTIAPSIVTISDKEIRISFFDKTRIKTEIITEHLTVH